MDDIPFDISSPAFLGPIPYIFVRFKCAIITGFSLNSSKSFIFPVFIYSSIFSIMPLPIHFNSRSFGLQIFFKLEDCNEFMALEYCVA